MLESLSKNHSYNKNMRCKGASNVDEGDAKLNNNKVTEKSEKKTSHTNTLSKNSGNIMINKKQSQESADNQQLPLEDLLHSEKNDKQSNPKNLQKEDANFFTAEKDSLMLSEIQNTSSFMHSNPVKMNHEESTSSIDKDRTPQSEQSKQNKSQDLVSMFDKLRSDNVKKNNEKEKIQSYSNIGIGLNQSDNQNALLAFRKKNCATNLENTKKFSNLLDDESDDESFNSGPLNIGNLIGRPVEKNASEPFKKINKNAHMVGNLMSIEKSDGKNKKRNHFEGISMNHGELNFENQKMNVEKNDFVMDIEDLKPFTGNFGSPCDNKEVNQMDNLIRETNFSQEDEENSTKSESDDNISRRTRSKKTEPTNTTKTTHEAKGNFSASKMAEELIPMGPAQSNDGKTNSAKKKKPYKKIVVPAEIKSSSGKKQADTEKSSHNSSSKNSYNHNYLSGANALLPFTSFSMSEEMSKVDDSTNISPIKIDVLEEFSRFKKADFKIPKNNTLTKLQKANNSKGSSPQKKNGKFQSPSKNNNCLNEGNIFFEKPVEKKSSAKSKKDSNKDFDIDISAQTNNLTLTQRSEISFQEKNQFNIDSNEKDESNDSIKNENCYKREPQILLSFGEFMDAVSSEKIRTEDVRLDKDKHLVMEYLFKLTSGI